MSMGRGRRASIVGIVVLLAALAGLVTLARRWLDVVEVRGHSMEPALLPGDRLLVERITFRWRPPRMGDLVLAHDPRQPSRELVKRVAGVEGDRLTLLGDNSGASTDSLAFGDVPRTTITWRVLARQSRVDGRVRHATGRSS